MSDLYKCCRWCHWWSGNSCNNPKAFPQDSAMNLAADSIYYFQDNGYLDEAAEEAFDVEKIMDIVGDELQDTRLSKKACQDAISAITEQISIYMKTVGFSEIVNAVTTCIRNRLSDDPDCAFSVEITDPEQFSCCYFE